MNYTKCLSTLDGLLSPCRGEYDRKGRVRSRLKPSWFPSDVLGPISCSGSRFLWWLVIWADMREEPEPELTTESLISRHLPVLQIAVV